MMMLTTTKISAVRAPTKTTRRTGVRQAAHARVAQKVRGGGRFIVHEQRRMMRASHRNQSTDSRNSLNSTPVHSKNGMGGLLLLLSTTTGKRARGWDD